jgi:hypothetical protein
MARTTRNFPRIKLASRIVTLVGRSKSQTIVAADILISSRDMTSEK